MARHDRPHRRGDPGRPPWTLSLRIPQWCTDYTSGGGARRRRRGPGRTAGCGWSGPGRPATRSSWTSPWRPASRAADPRVDAVRGCVAIERGPLVYCLEQADHPGGGLDDIVIDTTRPARREAPPRPARRCHHRRRRRVPAAPPRRGLVAVHARRPARTPAPGAEPVELTAVPYYAWANRAGRQHARLAAHLLNYRHSPCTRLRRVTPMTDNGHRTPHRRRCLAAGTARLAVAACSAAPAAGRLRPARRRAPTPSGTRTRSSTPPPLGQARHRLRHAGRGQRQAHRIDTTDLGNKALLAAQQGNAPDVMLVDNPVVSTLVEAGHPQQDERPGPRHHVDPEEHHRRGHARRRRLRRPDRRQHPGPLLQQEGPDGRRRRPRLASRTGHSLTAALQKVKAAGKKGITFSAIDTEEGSFQFLPWFWGAGGDLTKLDSAKGVAALSLWKELGRRRAGPQGRPAEHPDHQLAGVRHRRLRVRRERHLAARQRRQGRLRRTGSSTSPAQHGGSAPVPTGGEFVTVPVQKDSAPLRRQQEDRRRA